MITCGLALIYLAPYIGLVVIQMSEHICKNSNVNNQTEIIRSCPVCGTRASVTGMDMFCPKCGARYDMPTDDSPICPHCHGKNEEGAVFCEHCGKRIVEEE
ncbi:MAG: hypothetical protein Q4E57_05755 [Eubacteriales bacterium]|nr:hypothetical protein [Eubacteriales bacterium]